MIYTSADDDAMPGWSKAAFTARHEGAPLMSFIYATIKADFAYKLRITAQNPKDNSFQKFVAEFQKIVNDARPMP